MTRFVEGAVVAFIVTLICYLFISFVNLDLNVLRWSDIDRMFLGLFSAAFYFAVLRNAE